MIIFSRIFKTNTIKFNKDLFKQCAEVSSNSSQPSLAAVANRAALQSGHVDPAAAPAGESAASSLMRGFARFFVGESASSPQQPTSTATVVVSPVAARQTALLQQDASPDSSDSTDTATPTPSELE